MCSPTLSSLATIAASTAAASWHGRNVSHRVAWVGDRVGQARRGAPSPVGWRRRASLTRRAIPLLVLASLSCNGEPDAGPKPVFPTDLSGWAERRPCAFTHEHELRYIRVVCDELADVPYQELSEDYPYAEGATIVKLEYDDENCTELLGYTAMQKQAAGYSDTGRDWRWQRVTVDREVVEDGELETCITCHRFHCTPPECGYEGCGYDLTCGEEE